LAASSNCRIAMTNAFMFMLHTPLLTPSAR